jgi:ubiquinone/menaquinone biosynthesis C-methylase UbiE
MALTSDKKNIGTFDISVKRFNDFASIYAEKFMDIGSYRLHFDRFFDLIKKDQPCILELACGPGNVTRYIKQRFPQSDLIAIDLAPQMIEIARKQVDGVDFRLMDLRELRKINRQFDSIICSFGLPFLSKSDAEKLISDCSEKLVKDGVLYISTMEGDESKAGFETTSFSGDSEIYFNYHRKEELEKALTNNGFELEYSIRQDYREPDGVIAIDLILIAKKSK